MIRRRARRLRRQALAEPYPSKPIRLIVFTSGGFVASDNSVVDAVASRLSFTQPGSVDHQLIYLSVLGQMRNERALGPIERELPDRHL